MLESEDTGGSGDDDSDDASDVAGDCSDCASATDMPASSECCSDQPLDSNSESYVSTQVPLIEAMLHEIGKSVEARVGESDGVAEVDEPLRNLSLQDQECDVHLERIDSQYDRGSSSTSTVIHHSFDDGDLPRIHEGYTEGESWRKGSLLGTGAFSSCYSAMDTGTGAIMAVKQVSFCNNTTKDEKKMLMAISREIDLMSTFDDELCGGHCDFLCICVF
jgi:hypothetical protein